MIVSRRRLALIAALLAAAGCDAPEAAQARAARSEDPDRDPISIAIGGRTVQVRCALSCEVARGELARLRDRCVSDPTSSPHLVVAGAAPLVGLGCCTEASAAYAGACGEEGLEACASRWIAECESGAARP